MKNKLSDEKVLRAKKYAYHFFFRRSIPISSITHKRHSWPPFTLDRKGFKKILDGKDKKRTPEAIPTILSDALAVSFDNHIGHDYIEDAEARFKYYHTKEKKYQFDLFQID